ncbi:hypothetical protein C1645_832292 [Glomus cerebriforme]|uniref:Uncharacterized protein n=1 Tax=Glomus cerebriforme TaxID=658196 RepID=A0A397SHN0_9GLOM|nr:hypothetical protein C1645_832292 [Glomus cerebriforme]
MWKCFENVDTEEQIGNKEKPLKRCKILDSNRKKCKTFYINDSSIENSINHLLNDHKITKETQKYKENQQKELYQFLTNWIVKDLYPLYVVQNPSFWQLIGELDLTFIIPNEKEVKKVIFNAYNSILPALIEKFNIEARKVKSTFAKATEKLGRSKYVTNSIRTQMLMKIIKIIKPNSLDNQDSYNIDEQEEDVFKGKEQNLILNNDINEPVITFSLLDKVKIRLEIRITDLPTQSQSKPTTRKKKSLMEWLTKDNAGILNKIVEYYQLFKIPLSLDPLA